MSCVKLLLLLLAVVGGGSHAYKISNASFGIDSAELVTNPCQDLRLSGFICVDCSTLGFCSNVGNQWQTVSMTECQTERGFFCSDEGTIGCTWQPRCTVPVRGKFYCQSAGIFPDPYDCRNYHECSPQNVDTPHQCTNGAAFSLLTQSCSVPRETEQCTEKQYTCEYVGQTGVWAANSSYYYICQKEQQGDQAVFYPLMMKCSDGYIFNGHSCVYASRARTAERNMISCQDGLLYPADNSNGYFYCIEGQFVYQRCPLDYYFDEKVSACLKQPEICVDGTVYPAETDNGFYICAGGSLIYQSCLVGTTFDPATHICRPIVNSCYDFTTYPAETDHGFYICINGELVYESCPVGYSYDERYGVCFASNKNITNLTKFL